MAGAAAAQMSIGAGSLCEFDACPGPHKCAFNMQRVQQHGQATAPCTEPHTFYRAFSTLSHGVLMPRPDIKQDQM